MFIYHVRACNSQDWFAGYFFLPPGFTVLGGVIGLPEFKPPYWYFAFFSEGFKIYKKTLFVTVQNKMFVSSAKKKISGSRIYQKKCNVLLD